MLRYVIRFRTADAFSVSIPVLPESFITGFATIQDKSIHNPELAPGTIGVHLAILGADLTWLVGIGRVLSLTISVLSHIYRSFPYRPLIAHISPPTYWLWQFVNQFKTRT